MNAPVAERVLRKGMAAFGHDGAELGVVIDVSHPERFVVNDHGVQFVLDRSLIAIIALDFVLVRATGAQVRDGAVEARAS
jgi:hypothetical protein